MLAFSPCAVETERLVTLLKTRAESQFGGATRRRKRGTGLLYGRPVSVDVVAAIVAVFASSLPCVCAENRPARFLVVR